MPDQGYSIVQGLAGKSPLQILVQSIRDGAVEASDVRERMCALWANLGVISALILTMIRYTHNWGCPKGVATVFDNHRAFCETVHPALSVLAMATSLLSTILTSLLFAEASLIPEKHFAEFADKFGHLSGRAHTGLLASLVFWVTDTAWAGLIVYGAESIAFGSTLVLVAVLIYILVIARRMKNHVQEILTLDDQVQA